MVLRGMLVATAAALCLGGAACNYTSSDDEDGTALGGSGDGDTSIATTSPAPRPLRADGDGTDVCAAAEAPTVLADEAFDLEGVRWVFCVDTDQEHVLSLRSVAAGQWEVRELPVEAEEGGDLDVTVADADRAWATHDGLDSQTHEHLWTTDGGVNWTRIFPGD